MEGMYLCTVKDVCLNRRGTQLLKRAPDTFFFLWLKLLWPTEPHVICFPRWHLCLQHWKDKAPQSLPPFSFTEGRGGKARCLTYPDAIALVVLRRVKIILAWVWLSIAATGLTPWTVAKMEGTENSLSSLRKVGRIRVCLCLCLWNREFLTFMFFRKAPSLCAI